MLDQDLREILEVARRVGITEIDLSHGDLRLRVRRHAGVDAKPAPIERPAVVAQPAPTAETLVVRAPMVGYFFSGSRPGAAPCVAPGDAIGANNRIGCIETMGTITDIVADVAGIVEEYLVVDGSPVEFGQPVLRLRSKPAGALNGNGS